MTNPNVIVPVVEDWQEYSPFGVERLSIYLWRAYSRLEAC